MSDNNSGGDIGAFLAGFVIGGLVGAAAALILAPQSGEETRHQIADRGRELRQVSSERLNEYRSKTGDYLSETRGRLQDATSQAQERTRIILDQGKERVTQLRQDITGLVRKEESEGDTSAAA
ncbi:MAG: YtxH domain-containing protein [Chloroflexi bacterium]|nr:YtxH domain-containing protein [Chloroflexota bacterium]MBP8055466.1 YtxH domain-containing protein [Chloroflexota bacterium]